MRRIFSGLRTIIGWDQPFSAYTAVFPSSDDYTRPIGLDGRVYRPRLPAGAFTITVRRSTYRSKIQKTKRG